MAVQLTWDQYNTSSTQPVVSDNQPATPKTPVTSPKSREQLHKEFIKIFDGLCHAHHRWEVWQDWTEAAAISIHNSVNYDRELEDQYLKIVGKYEREEVQQFPKLLSLTTMALDTEFCDFLGTIFMELELPNKFGGQFFTPYELSKFTAQVTFSDYDSDTDEVIEFNEPAVGAGSFVIAVCEMLHEKGVNFQNRLKVTAQDSDYMVFCMAYTQLSLIGCPAQLVHGNTLKLENKQTWYTPMWYLRGFN